MPYPLLESAKDILTLRSILKRNKSPIKIIAKIENQEGLDNIHEITQAADIVMVARGDLGIETILLIFQIFKGVSCMQVQNGEQDQLLQLIY